MHYTCLNMVGYQQIWKTSFSVSCYVLHHQAFFFTYARMQLCYDAQTIVQLQL